MKKMKKIILMLSFGICLYSCDSSKKVPNELIAKIQESYNEEVNLDEQENFNKNVNSNKNFKRKKGLFKRKPKLAHNFIFELCFGSKKFWAK